MPQPYLAWFTKSLPTEYRFFLLRDTGGAGRVSGTGALKSIRTEEMYRPRIYLDTSVIGGCFDDEFKQYSNQLFEEFISGKKKIVISDIVLFELEGAPENVKEVLWQRMVQRMGSHLDL